MLSSLSWQIPRRRGTEDRCRGSPVEKHSGLSYVDSQTSSPGAGIFHHTWDFPMSGQVMPVQYISRLQRREGKGFKVLCG
jgi:hypothetical protein